MTTKPTSNDPARDAGSDNTGTDSTGSARRRTARDSVQDAIGKLIGDDAACDPDPASDRTKPAGKPGAAEAGTTRRR